MLKNPKKKQFTSGCDTAYTYFSCKFRQKEIPASCIDEGIIGSTSKVSMTECADACAGVEGCAFYIFDPMENGSEDCTLFKSCLNMQLK